jgi:dUTP pyrophosphatase
MKVKIVNKSKHPLPNYETIGSAGMDLRANINESIWIKPLQRILIPIDIYIELPIGYESQIRPRSGLAIKHGITVLNSPGTLDSDYRGNLLVMLVNLSNEDYCINDGDRVAQMIISKHEKAEFIEVDKLDDTDRGSGGFGSTGKQ